MVDEEDDRVRLINRAVDASSVTRDSALLELVRSENMDNDLQGLNFVAVALAACGDIEAAIKTFREIIVSVDRFLSARFNLAGCHMVLGEGFLALCELEDAFRGGVSYKAPEEHIDAAQRRLDELRRWDSRQNLRGRLAEFRVAMLRERVTNNIAHPGDLRRLGYALIHLSSRHDSNVELRDAITVLEKASVENPGDVKCLETLTIARTLERPSDRSDDSALRRLENIAPHSAIISNISIGVSEHEDEYPEIIGRLHRLLGDLEANTYRSTAAVLEIRRIARSHPREMGFQYACMFAIARRGNAAEALSMAERLLGQEKTFDTYFHVGQLFHLLERFDESKALLDQARELADNESDRELLKLWQAKISR